MWHCPHCGAPQAETARCWVCRRSSTTCSTCRHFRASLAADLGYCALDRRRLPLTGLELRGCWTAPRAAAEPVRVGLRDRPDAVRTRGFVPIDEVAPIAAPAPVEEAPAPVLPPPVLDNLFGDLEA